MWWGGAMSIRILLADDHRVIREGLRSLIDNQPDMEVVAEAEDGREAVQLAIELVPDVVIMDIAMPKLNGVDATHQILKERPGVKVLALSMHINKQFVSYMLKAGASGYMLKSCAFDELVKAIEAIMSNHTYLTPGVSDFLVKDYVDNLPEKDSVICPQLSPREREVLQLIAEGRTTKQIARDLHVSAKTVATHREHIMSKTDLSNVAELVRYAAQIGLTSFDFSLSPE